jgi:hypothetical protein
LIYFALKRYGTRQRKKIFHRWEKICYINFFDSLILLLFFFNRLMSQRDTFLVFRPKRISLSFWVLCLLRGILPPRTSMKSEGEISPEDALAQKKPKNKPKGLFLGDFYGQSRRKSSAKASFKAQFCVIPTPLRGVGSRKVFTRGPKSMEAF